MKVIIINDTIINFNNVSLIEHDYDRLLIYLISNIPMPDFISTTGTNMTRGNDCIDTRNHSEIKYGRRLPDIDITFERSIKKEEYKRIKDFFKNKEETALELNIKTKSFHIYS
ncbi:hypothetical protein [Brachyspira sp.]|uniref:hypothetical protein n=1 Tax=Brachyspira sp. TaxID=1977261 RepID=UPI003D7E22CF